MNISTNKNLPLQDNAIKLRVTVIPSGRSVRRDLRIVFTFAVKSVRRSLDYARDDSFFKEYDIASKEESMQRKG